MAEKMKQLTILKNYFGTRPEQFRAIDEATGQPLNALKDFAKEIQALTAGDKAELVQGAAKELGVEVEYVTEHNG